MRDERFEIGGYWLSRRRGSDNWCRTWFEKRSRQTKRSSLGVTDFEEAKQKLAEWITLHRDMRSEPVSEVFLTEVIKRYYDKHAINLPSAEAAYGALCKWLDFFGTETVADLTLDRQDEFIASLRKSGASDGYIRRIIGCGKAALNFAYRRQEIASVPYLKVPPSGEQRERVLSLGEAAALFNEAESEHLFRFLMLSFNTLARPTALLQLTRFRVDTENRFIDLNPKGRSQTKKKRPSVPLTATLLPWVQQWTDDYLVNWKGRPIKSIKGAFRKARDRAGLDQEVVPYTIRHTMATELRKRGVPMWEVQGIMGHRTGGVTERYAKYAPDYLGDASRAIDEYFQELAVEVKKPLILKGLRASCVLVEKS